MTHDPVAGAVVVRVEEKRKIGVEQFVAFGIFHQHEGFEKPGGVAEAPFGWADKFGRLCHIISVASGLNNCSVYFRVWLKRAVNLFIVHR